ncbi:four-carbon acid sugar kinase family protein [Mesorhizobium sp. M9A.F.Ca.ET.002.03.1.2]|uniref:3-oxo-tetronate kinase n=1 Tax=Mesorhizobium sp. M9A.F.Ca.ET.002.03.1.2 TaxID=2493668 RepID=UPI000F758953|nr:3-oxo-tetronate kinase [Mesorhizobium sp. M9A.F.Ca.ET.002.03.1.2]AZN96141.1 four-carbon acid sugar kinase family protein [Mesorhizobium sp. M9A.F.Ca.ET.002.03.1.2]
MLLGAIADDFTGASDLANTLAKGGMATTQFIGTSADPAPSGCEAGVVALKTRSIAAEQAVRQSLEAARWLLAQGCEQIVFKYCSTFDSTPKGNIGPVVEALLDLLGADVAVVCPAFPATGRRLFMGHLFVGDRLLNESGMENHPLTPMTDPDIRRWLRLQTRGEVGLVPLHTVRGGVSAIGQAFAEQQAQGRRLVVADAVAEDDLRLLGQALAGHRLVTGGSGIAMGLPENFRKAGRLSQRTHAAASAAGPAVVLCGSCSKASQAQVAAYLAAHPGLALDPAALMDKTMTIDHAVDWFWRQKQVPIIYSTADATAVSGAQARYGRAEVAETIERFFATLVRRLVDGGVRRVVVGGGETSGAVVEALGVSSLRIGEEIDPGVPALLADRGGPLGLALKSGNFGANDFFEKAVQRIGTL